MVYYLMPLDNAWSLPDEMKCPQCDKSFPWASGVNGDKPPDPGDNTICSSCGTISTFADDMSIRLATTEEIESALKPEVCRRAYEALLMQLLQESSTEGSGNNIYPTPSDKLIR